MWKDSDDLLIYADENNLFSSMYPKTCPVCNHKSVHLYLHRFEENDSIGAIWLWCSNCMSYTHAQFRIPNSWNNLATIDENALESDPEYLEGIFMDIDDHTNKIASSTK
jgi:transcription elongation factor Elf1